MRRTFSKATEVQKRMSLDKKSQLQIICEEQKSFAAFKRLNKALESNLNTRLDVMWKSDDTYTESAEEPLRLMVETYLPNSIPLTCEPEVIDREQPQIYEEDLFLP